MDALNDSRGSLHLGLTEHCEHALASPGLMVRKKSGNRFGRRRCCRSAGAVFYKRHILYSGITVLQSFLYHYRIPRIPRICRGVIEHYYFVDDHEQYIRKKGHLPNGRKSWSILALCRLGLGICLHVLLSNLIRSGNLIYTKKHVTSERKYSCST